MVFKRRDKPPLLSRLREAVLPRRGFRRGFEYLTHRVRRLPDTPHRIALGFAIGTWVNFTPLFGFHLLLAIGLARLLRANVLASIIGTFVGNPLTTPFIASFSLELGHRILGYGASGRDFGRIAGAFAQFFDGLWQVVLLPFGRGIVDWAKLTLFLRDVVWPWMVGGFLPGIIAAIAAYYLSRPLITAYQATRRARFAARAERRVAEAATKAAAAAGGAAAGPAAGPAAAKEAGASAPAAYDPAPAEGPGRGPGRKPAKGPITKGDALP